MGRAGTLPASRTMRLTPELVARVPVPSDIGESAPQSPGRRPATEADYADVLRDTLASAPENEPVWIFAYGSLIWNPAFESVERRNGITFGWHRSFRLGWDKWFRGTAKQPGLMLTLDRGGQCQGVAFRIPHETVRQNLDTLFRREIRFIPSSHRPRRVSVSTREGPLRAIAFVVNRQSAGYVGSLPVQEVADVLALARGRLGSMAEYLYQTVRHLEDAGIHDRHLWQLQEMVAQRLHALAGGES
jgi:glutathione-specific gamma-glutamylcyclotransferase